MISREKKSNLAGAIFLIASFRIADKLSNTQEYHDSEPSVLCKMTIWVFGLYKGGLACFS